jgi:CheY-like chemotaxis protein
MLIDDDEDDCMIFSAVVNEINTNINCTCVPNAIDCIETLRSQPAPDCIFLDLNMPFMHGFDFLRLLKTSEELNRIPVIIYSTSSREADMIKAKELGALNFLRKQTSFSELKDKLGSLLAPFNFDC